MKSLIAAAGCVVLFVSACTSSDEQQQSISSTPVKLAEPRVVIEADPAPPFTYWAPEGSTIRNHPRNPAIWVAQVAGQPERYYYGDQCQASRYQHLLGRPLTEMPDPPEEAIWRTHCSKCAERRRDRGKLEPLLAWRMEHLPIIAVDMLIRRKGCICQNFRRQPQSSCSG
ncbi:hypothetical protein EJ066_25010 [Mesorhizobium sp. M9A.F.Ca.ET.002.03.1.2]|nr:hypothetical protein EJ066_25010 [Mesorhizobium sp. M9A.F.Ca.ET.002.03.1.2]